MNKFKLFAATLASASLLALLLVTALPKVSYAAPSAPTNAIECQLSGGKLLGFPTWYKYLKGQAGVEPGTLRPTCQPVLGSINSIWGIVAAVIEILLRIAALVAITFVVVGGVTYTISQGQPDKTKQALQTIISALVGLVISIAATAIVSFIAGSFVSK